MKTHEFPKYEIIKTTDGALVPCWNVLCTELGNSGYLYKEEQVEYWVGRNIKKYISLDEYQVAVNKGEIIKRTKALDEQLEDGLAHRALIRDIGDLGFEDFDQVMALLKAHRGEVLQPREFEVWVEGYQATGEHNTAHLVGKAMGYSFRDAVHNLKATFDPKTTRDWSIDGPVMNIWGCTLYDNETDARKAFG